VPVAGEFPIVLQTQSGHNLSPSGKTTSNRLGSRDSPTTRGAQRSGCHADGQRAEARRLARRQRSSDPEKEVAVAEALIRQRV
jgi:hypothetical protein